MTTEISELRASDDNRSHAFVAYLEALDGAANPAADEPRSEAPKYLSETDPQAA